MNALMSKVMRPCESLEYGIMLKRIVSHCKLAWSGLQLQRCNKEKRKAAALLPQCHDVGQWLCFWGQCYDQIIPHGQKLKKNYPR